jgi:hypothetical protein
MPRLNRAQRRHPPKAPRSTPKKKQRMTRAERRWRKKHAERPVLVAVG